MHFISMTLCILNVVDSMGSIFVPAQSWSERRSRRICNFVQHKWLFPPSAPSCYFNEPGCTELGEAVRQRVGR